MIANTERWTYLGRASKDTHKFFTEAGTGKVAIADCSGTYPHQTDDGVLYLELPLQVTGPTPFGCGHVHYSLRLVRPNGEKTGTIIGPEERQWLMSQQWSQGAPLPQGLSQTYVLTEWEAFVLRNLVRDHVKRLTAEDPAGNAHIVGELSALVKKLVSPRAEQGSLHERQARTNSLW